MMRGSSKLGTWWCRALGRESCESRRLLVTQSNVSPPLISRPESTTLLSPGGRYGGVCLGNSAHFSSAADATDDGRKKPFVREEVRYSPPVQPSLQHIWGFEAEEFGPKRPFINDFTTIMPPHVIDPNYKDPSEEPPAPPVPPAPVAPSPAAAPEPGNYYGASQFPEAPQLRLRNDRFFRARNNSTVANMLKLLEAAASESDVEKILEERIPTAADSRVWPWLPLLDALQKGPKPYLALEVFYWKKEKFEGGDPREYAKMISTAGKLNQLELARTLFQEMEERGLKRTPITCNALISAYSKNDQPDQALAIFEEMQVAEDCKPTLVTYNTLISMYSKLNVSQMEKYYNLCKSSGFFPDRVTFNSMIWGYMRGNEFDKMETMYEQLKGSGCRPDPITFSALIIGFSKANAAEKMELAFSHMQEEGIPISTMIAEILTEFYAMGKKFEKMERIMKIVANTPGTSISSRIYGFAIQSYAESGRMKDMEDIMDRMFMSKRLFTSAKTLEAVITAYGSLYNFEAMESVLERIKGMGWSFQHSTYHTLLYEYGKGRQFEKMEKLFLEMGRALDVEPTKETYKILADSYRLAGDAVGLQKTVNRMSAAGFKEVVETEIDRSWTDDEIFGGKPR